jgi:hypothetical protein
VARNAGHRRQPMSAAGLPFSLGTFSWALKRKYLARMGEIKS